MARKGQLTASIAHEVKQPIAVCTISAQTALRWLNAQPPQLEEARQAVGRIVRNCDRAIQVIEGIRALAKKAPCRKDRLEINEAILEVIELLNGEIVKNAVTVRTQLAEALPRVRGDRVQLQQVIFNLMVNAVDAMRGVSTGSRELHISTGRARSVVYVQVRDSGPGFGPESVDQVFEPFYTTKPDGLGIGLSICSSIIKAHGGRLWASANEPTGATFQFTLPLYSDGASRENDYRPRERTRERHS